MKLSRLICCTFLGLLMLPMGCDSKQEKVQKNMTSLMGEYADVLEGIKTNTDFIDAKPKLERIGAKMKDLMNEYKALPTPTADEQKKMNKEFEESNKKVTERISKEMQRLEKVGVSPMQLMESMKVSPEMVP